MLFLNCIILGTALAAIDESKIKIFRWRGPGVLDETIFTNPSSFDYDFSDDLKKDADPNDLYDQLVQPLPTFRKIKLGVDLGATKVPIVTRKWDTWSTKADTRGPQGLFATSPMPVKPKFAEDLELTTAKPTKSDKTESNTIEEDSSKPKTSGRQQKTSHSDTEKKEKTSKTATEEDTKQTIPVRKHKKLPGFEIEEEKITTTEAPMTAKKSKKVTHTIKATTSTEAPKTTKKAKKLTTTTPRVTTSATKKTKMSITTTTEATTTVHTSKRMRTRTTTHRPTTSRSTTVTTTQKPTTISKFAAQPRPAFKSGRRPIWRKGGKIVFEDDTEEITTTVSPTTTTRKTHATTAATRHTTHRTTSAHPAIDRRTMRVIGVRVNQQHNRPAHSRNNQRVTGVRMNNKQHERSTTRSPQHSNQRVTGARVNHRQTTQRPTTQRTQNRLSQRIIGVRVTTTPQSRRSHFTRRPVQTTTRGPMVNYRSQPKPVIIQHGNQMHRGPTYNCRVLNPFTDGKASKEHDKSCKMQYPGLSADGSCRCYYKVSGRDENGCAEGFLYACKPLFRHSVVV